MCLDYEKLLSFAGAKSMRGGAVELRPERDIGLGSLDIFLWRKESVGGLSAGQQQVLICSLEDPPDGHVRVDFRTSLRQNLRGLLKPRFSPECLLRPQGSLGTQGTRQCL